MSSQRSRQRLKTAQRRIHEIRAQIRHIEYVAAGTISRRTKRCGKPECRCAKDPDARHGPYVEWTRLEGGKLRSTLVDPRLVPALTTAIKEQRRLHRLRRAWEHESLRALEASIDVTPGQVER